MKFSFFLLVFISLFSDITSAQKLGGSFQYGTNPGFTKKDTLIDVVNDTFYLPTSSFRNSISFQINVLKISGNPGSCGIEVYASIEPGIPVNYFRVYNFSVVDVSKQSFVYLVNNGYGNPFTYYMIVFDGAGAYHASWQAYCLFR